MYVVLDGKTHTNVIGTVRTIFGSARLKSRNTAQVLVVQIYLENFRRAEEDVRNVDFLDRQSNKSNTATEETDDERVPKKVNRFQLRAS